MSFAADIKRFNDKRTNVNIFKCALMTFEDIRTHLSMKYAHSYFDCPHCGGNEQIVSPHIDVVLLGRSPSVAAVHPSWLVHAFLKLGNGTHVCPSCSKPVDITAISAVECNPTVINEGLNDVLQKVSSSFYGVMCYKFGMHFEGYRSEPVYLVLCGSKNRWNFDVTHVFVVQFPSKDPTTPFPATLQCASFGISIDGKTNRIVDAHKIEEEVEKLLCESFNSSVK